MKKAKIATGILLILTAASLMSYPLLAERRSATLTDAVFTETASKVEDADAAELEAEYEAAAEYNRRLASGTENVDGQYENLLNVGGDGVMCLLKIPCIDVRLPVYHGTEDETLLHGVGHIEGTSLPVGGEGTRAVISGHSGMNNNKMLTDLHKLEIGDRFYLSVLGRTLVYEVRDIRVVLPNDSSVLQPEKGKDEVSLVTCTPFGVNSHRLVVTGERIAADDAETEQLIRQIDAEGKKGSTWEEKYIEALLLGLLFFFLPGVLFLIFRRVRRKRVQRKEGEKDV